MELSQVTEERNALGKMASELWSGKRGYQSIASWSWRVVDLISDIKMEGQV